MTDDASPSAGIEPAERQVIYIVDSVERPYSPPLRGRYREPPPQPAQEGANGAWLMLILPVMAMAVVVFTLLLIRNI